MVWIFVGVVVLVGIDYVTKWMALQHLQHISAVPVIPWLFDLSYVENRGMAFGMMQGGIPFFVVMTLLVCGYLIYKYVQYSKKGKRNIFVSLSVMLVLAGAVGNLVDRVTRGFVVDFFRFTWIQFPVFNMADIYVCVGAFIMLIILLFTKEELL